MGGWGGNTIQIYIRKVYFFNLTPSPPHVPLKTTVFATLAGMLGSEHAEGFKGSRILKGDGG
jgi:hypothetical protein